MSATPPPPKRAPTGFWRGLWNALDWTGFAAVVAALALLLSGGQLLWPLYRNAVSSYSVRAVTPDLVNFFCEGSEGEDIIGGSAPCDASKPLSLIVTPLSYINEATAEKPVWLRREFVTVTFQDKLKNQFKGPIILFWYLVKSSQSWGPPAVVALKPGEAVSHSTLFYPSSYGCKTGVPFDDCLGQNTYLWANFAEDVSKGRIKYALLNFTPDFIGPQRVADFETPPNSIAPSSCELTFDDAQKAKLGDSQASHYIAVRCNETTKTK
jgi:hypothetical protein